MGPNNQPPMNPTPPMASHNFSFLNIRLYRRQLWRSVDPLDAWVTFPTRSYPTTRSRYLERATQVRRIGRRKNRQWEGESTSCGLRRHLSAGTRTCITEDDAFTDTLREAMSISRRASSRVRSTAKPVLQEAPILPSHRTPRLLPFLLYYLISTPPVLSQHAKIDRVILISSLGYIKNSIFFEPTSSFLVDSIFTYLSTSTITRQVQQTKIPIVILRHISQPHL